MDDMQKRVSIIKDTDHKKAVFAALEQLEGVDDVVKNFSRIVIKPNLCGGVESEPGSYTSTTVLRSVLELFSAFSVPLFVGEADCSFNDAGHMFSSLGIHALGKQFGATVVNLSEGSYADVTVPHCNAIRTLRISTVLQDSLIVSVPVLKTHPWSGVTVSMKNMYGAVYQRAKAMYHTGLEKNIVDINSVIGAHISIVDATVAVVHGGFKYGLWVGSPSSRLDLIIAGFNPVAVDAVGARILNRDPGDIGHIRLAAAQGMGCCNSKELEILCRGYSWPGSEQQVM